MKTYYFVRHGASTADSGEMELDGVNAPATVEDIPLSDLGREEAEKCAAFFKRLGNIEAVYSSPLIRTYDTAEIIAKEIDLEVQVLPEVKEVDLSGVLNFFKKRHGRSSVKVSPKDLPLNLFRGVMMGTGLLLFGVWRLMGRIPNNETLEEVKTRVERAFRILAAAPEERIIVASHGYLLTYIGSYLVEKNFANLPNLRGRAWVPNCSVTKIIARDNGELELVYFARDDYDKIS